MPESPYIIDPEAQTRTMELESTDKRKRPDGSVEPDAVVDPDVMQEFLRKVGVLKDGGEDVLQRHVMGAKLIREADGETGEVKDHSPSISELGDEQQQAIFNKVAIFLDPKLHGPVTFAVARHKIFVLRVPVAQEMLDAATFASKGGSMMEIIGELVKAVVGWIPENSPSAHLLRAHINDPSKWPPLRELDWLASRDPGYLEYEVIPVWDKYLKWRAEVVPTAEEIDFYYSRLV